MANYNVHVQKSRLDVLLLERGLVTSRSRAQAVVMAGQVRVNGQVLLKPSTRVDAASTLEVESAPRYVSRGGEKLEAALVGFDLSIQRLTCADVGASTGGFVDCLLQHGAARVYAIDVGKGLLDWKLRTDPRVVVLEQTNARYLERLPEPVDLVTVDASFISLRVLLPVVRAWLRPAFSAAGTPEDSEQTRPSAIIALIKPQFEAGRRDAARGAGVIRDPALHRQILLDVLDFAQTQALTAVGLLRSPLLGPKGNAEFLVWLEPAGHRPRFDLRTLVSSVLD